MSLLDRLRKLEAAQPPITHHRGVVQVPWGLESADYLATLACPCGRRDCPERTYGMVVPARCQTAEEWVERYAHYWEQSA
jgi:hypothetical protein